MKEEIDREVLHSAQEQVHEERETTSCKARRESCSSRETGHTILIWSSAGSSEKQVKAIFCVKTQEYVFDALNKKSNADELRPTSEGHLSLNKES